MQTYGKQFEIVLRNKMNIKVSISLIQNTDHIQCIHCGCVSCILDASGIYLLHNRPSPTGYLRNVS